MTSSETSITLILWRLQCQLRTVLPSSHLCSKTAVEYIQAGDDLLMRSCRANSSCHPSILLVYSVSLTLPSRKVATINQLHNRIPTSAQCIVVTPPLVQNIPLAYRPHRCLRRLLWTTAEPGAVPVLPPIVQREAASPYPLLLLLLTTPLPPAHHFCGFSAATDDTAPSSAA